MTNNQSEKPEKLKPQDSERKEIKHPQDDTEAVVKPDDLDYEKEDADFGSIEKRKAENEQPINSVSEAPKKVWKEDEK